MTEERFLGTKRIYLAGGLRSDWQDKVICSVPALSYLDPRSHGLEDEIDYTQWDLDAIAACDLVFAYLEGNNPAGYSLALEVGYARALGKYIIYVDEKSVVHPDTAKYLGMVRASANDVCFTIEEGIARLLSITGLRSSQ